MLITKGNSSLSNIGDRTETLDWYRGTMGVMDDRIAVEAERQE